MNRRNFMKVTGGATIITLAGCVDINESIPISIQNKYNEDLELNLILFPNGLDEGNEIEVPVEISSNQTQTISQQLPIESDIPSIRLVINNEVHSYVVENPENTLNVEIIINSPDDVEFEIPDVETSGQ